MAQLSSLLLCGVIIVLTLVFGNGDQNGVTASRSRGRKKPFVNPTNDEDGRIINCYHCSSDRHPDCVSNPEKQTTFIAPCRPNEELPFAYCTTYLITPKGRDRKKGKGGRGGVLRRGCALNREPWPNRCGEWFDDKIEGEYCNCVTPLCNKCTGRTCPSVPTNGCLTRDNTTGERSSGKWSSSHKLRGQRLI